MHLIMNQKETTYLVGGAREERGGLEKRLKNLHFQEVGTREMGWVKAKEEKNGREGRG